MPDNTPLPPELEDTYPTAGGCYVRNPDGSLSPDPTTTPAPPPAPAPAPEPAP